MTLLIGIRGALAEVITALRASPKGQPLAVVLSAIEQEIAGGHVEASADGHRATVRLPNGRLVSVRVTAPKSQHPGATPKLRFKPPRDGGKFETIYFGGVDRHGRAVVHRRKPIEIGPIRTLTLPCGEG